MSFKIRRTIILKLNPNEYDHLMLCRKMGFVPTEKGMKFLQFVRNKMPFGECQVISKDGQPWRIERAIESELLNLQTVDNSNVSSINQTI